MFSIGDKALASLDKMNEKLDKIVVLLDIIARLGKQLLDESKPVKLRK